MDFTNVTVKKLNGGNSYVESAVVIPADMSSTLAQTRNASANVSVGTSLTCPVGLSADLGIVLCCCAASHRVSGVTSGHRAAIRAYTGPQSLRKRHCAASFIWQ